MKVRSGRERQMQQQVTEQVVLAIEYADNFIPRLRIKRMLVNGKRKRFEKPPQSKRTAG
jgi:hypothetical protein